MIPIENITTLEAKYKVNITESFYPVDPSKITKQMKSGKSLISFKSDKTI